MKQILFAVVLVAVTGLGILARSALSGDASAARSPEPQPGTSGRLRPEKERTVAAVAETAPETAEMQMARQAAKYGSGLLERAARSADAKKLLRQATAHFRACLAYEAAGPKGEPLFAEARAKLAEAEKQLAKPPAAPAPEAEKRPAPAPSARPAPVVAKKPAPAVKKADHPAPAPVAVGPDGVIFRRAEE